MSTDRWMDKEDMGLYIYSGILFNHRKEWNKGITSNTNGPRDYHTEWSKSDRERQILYDITYMWNLKRWYKLTCLQNGNRLTDFKNKFTATKGER